MKGDTIMSTYMVYFHIFHPCSDSSWSKIATSTYFYRGMRYHASTRHRRDIWCAESEAMQSRLRREIRNPIQCTPFFVCTDSDIKYPLQNRFSAKENVRCSKKQKASKEKSYMLYECVCMVQAQATSISASIHYSFLGGSNYGVCPCVFSLNG